MPLHMSRIPTTAPSPTNDAAMDITKFVTGYREAAFLIGDYNTYRDQLARRLRIVNKKLGRATPKNAKYAAKAAVTTEDIKQNSEYDTPREPLDCALTKSGLFTSSC
jgi:hypothetical protein